ncbi:hypothetical protein [Kutzneria sp. CA-103260]|uniref:hypothetical protein n=1 Tax=Kutzneria sp. CA-103260 TaxID=2802641 RepID=UPI001BA47273|nr:hypothetical protein [Kutzneria sp. CA-103260]QUQ65836.1 hypothetical protein JJ691_35610 [Kutzneria sp. CA-103260]
MPVASDFSERPVFVDPSGRRRRFLRRLAIAVCALFAAYVVLLCAALSGAPIPPSALLPLPGAPTSVEPTAIDQQPEQSGVPTLATTSASHVGRTSHTAATTATVAQPTLTSQLSAGPTVTTTTGNRNSHAPSTPPGRVRRTDTTTPSP